MMPGEMGQFVHTKPFRPFRLTRSDGRTFEVRFREAFVLTPTYVVVGLLPNSDGTSYSGTIILDLLSVTSVEPLPIPVSPHGNGQQDTN